jgi:hypothetical protein
LVRTCSNLEIVKVKLRALRGVRSPILPCLKF